MGQGKEEEMMKLLKQFDRDYWLYWTASAVSMAASNILQYILSLYVLKITGSATLFASMLSIIVLPRLFLTLDHPRTACSLCHHVQSPTDGCRPPRTL